MNAPTDNLVVWVEGGHAATLRHVDEAFELTYTPQWQGSGGYAFSPHLPLGEATRGAAVKNFFSNLLPEGHALESLSRAHQVSKHDVFGILKKVGRDCAGALVLTEEGQVPDKPDQAYQPVSALELNQRITEARAEEVPLMFWKGKRRMSLAGVQNKLGVYLTLNEGFELPIDAAPTSHILKVGDPKHEDIAANEYFCMQLARSVGLAVPDTLFKKLPEPVLLVQRYDRLWDVPVSGGLRRIHQIDGCQALNLPPEQKYEEPHYEYAPPGAAVADLVKLAQLCRVPAGAQTILLNWVLFNYLIGNSDAHAKNISFMVNPLRPTQRALELEVGMSVAPLYDLVCGAVYGYHDMAQTIGGESNFAVLDRSHWAQLAKDCAVPEVLLQRLTAGLLKRMSAVLPKVAAAVTAETGAEVVQRIHALVAAHCDRLQLNLVAKGWRSAN
ncbi:MAG TPA: HipA domain-containing protein [Polaromonas sp.]